ncbi:MAG: hypothetical protein ACOX1P_08605 [Thermoguttaceae bacterium]
MRPHETAILFAIVAGTAFSSPAAFAGDAGDAGEAARPGLVFCCTAENDLYRVITAGGREYPRSDSAAEAVRAAAEGAGVLILADGYPGKATPIAPEVLEEASRKKLRLYIEYPSALPGLELGQPRQCPWERVVVASDAFGPELPRMRILMIHDCRMLPVEAARPHLVSAWVAGFDTAVYGLPGETWPLLFEHPQGQLLIATTKLSHFVTGRYSPSDAWHSVWRMIFGWLTPGAAPPELAWTPTVRPTYGRDEPLPKDAELSALKRGAEWFLKSRFLVHPAWKDKYARSPAGRFHRFRPGRSGPRPRLADRRREPGHLGRALVDDLPRRLAADPLGAARRLQHRNGHGPGASLADRRRPEVCRNRSEPGRLRLFQLAAHTAAREPIRRALLTGC